MRVGDAAINENRIVFANACGAGIYGRPGIFDLSIHYPYMLVVYAARSREIYGRSTGNRRTKLVGFHDGADETVSNDQYLFGG